MIERDRATGGRKARGGKGPESGGDGGGSYRRGRSPFDARTPVGLRISGGNMTVERPYIHRLVAIVDYSNGTSQGFSQEAEWVCDPASVAAIEFDPGEKVMAARCTGIGSAIITARFQEGGQSVEGRISVDVKYPTITLVPSGGTYRVGDVVQFQATTKGWSRGLPPSAVRWSAQPANVATIDADGKATFLKSGTAEIAVTEREVSPILIVAKIEVAA